MWNTWKPEPPAPSARTRGLGGEASYAVPAAHKDDNRHIFHLNALQHKAISQQRTRCALMLVRRGLVSHVDRDQLLNLMRANLRITRKGPKVTRCGSLSGAGRPRTCAGGVNEGMPAKAREREHKSDS